MYACDEKQTNKQLKKEINKGILWIVCFLVIKDKSTKSKSKLIHF